MLNDMISKEECKGEEKAESSIIKKPFKATIRLIRKRKPEDKCLRQHKY